MNIFVNLKENKELSNNERIIADYILKHPDDVLEMTSSQLAKACFVSNSTIYRLCDKLHLSGFSDLKIKLTSSINEYKSTSDFNFDFPINNNQTHYEIINQIKEDYEQTINFTNSFFDLDQLRLATFALDKAKVIDIYTSAGNINFALNFKFQMQEIGQLVNVPIEEYVQRLTAASSDADHLAIIITFGGRGLLTDIIPRTLKKNNTPILLISSYEYTSKEYTPDFQLYMCSYENHYKKISSFSTRLSLLYILDVLYTSYFKLDYDNNVKNKLNYYNTMISNSNI